MASVVYIDDEPSLCRLFDWFAEAEGIDARAFSSATQALSYVADNDVKVVICDYRMPEMDGAEVLQRITKNVKFLLTSGELERQDDLTSDPRVVGHLLKPFAPEELKRILDRLLASD